MMLSATSLAGEFERVGVAPLVRRESAPDARLGGEPAELRANRGPRPRLPAGGPSMMHADLAAATALATALRSRRGGARARERSTRRLRGDVWFTQPAPKGVREILECWFDGRPIREEYLIVQSPPRGSFGTTRLSLSKSLTMPGDSPVSAPAEEWFSTGFDSGTAADRPPRRKCAPDNRGDRGHIRALPHHEGRWKRRFPNSKRPERPPLSPTTWARNSDTTSWDLTCSRAARDFPV